VGCQRGELYITTGRPGSGDPLRWDGTGTAWRAADPVSPWPASSWRGWLRHKCGLAAHRVEQLSRAVPISHENLASVRTERQLPHFCHVAHERGQVLASFGIPEANHAIGVGRGEAPTIAAERELSGQYLQRINRRARRTFMTKPRTDAKRKKRIEQEIVVDAYDEWERAMGWFYYLEQTLQFPFRAECVKESAKRWR
jgi:Calcium binding